MEKKATDNLHDFLKWLIFICLGMGLWLWAKAQILKKEPYVTTRKAFSEQYKVDLKTFNKWVQLIANQAILPYNTFIKQRGLTQKQCDYLLNLFGSPTEDKPKYSKADIVSDGKIGPNDYRDVLASIKKYPDKSTISYEIYTQLNFLPPRIGRALKHHVGN